MGENVLGAAGGSPTGEYRRDRNLGFFGGRAGCLRRWALRPLASATAARAAYLGSVSRHDRSDRRTRVPALGAGSRHHHRFGLRVLFEPEDRAGDHRPRALQLDIALAEFGPETKEARADLKAGTQRVYHMFWGEKPLFDSDPGQLAPGAIESLKATDAGIAALEPRTPLQKQAAAAAVVDAGLIQNTRLSIALQLKSPVSWPLVTVVVLWSVLLFCGFGLLSRINATTIAALGFGAFAVGSALFLIIELSQPYTGLFRVPPGALEESIEEMGK
jgi:hypothetical protein